MKKFLTDCVTLFVFGAWLVGLGLYLINPPLCAIWFGMIFIAMAVANYEL